MNESLKSQNGAAVEDRGPRVSRNKRTRLLKGNFTHEESALLRPFPVKWWVPLISGAVAEGLSLERFLSHEEKIKKVVGIQLSSLDHSILMDRTRKPGPERIQSIMAGLS